MNEVFIDTSALIKRYIDEPGSDEIIDMSNPCFIGYKCYLLARDDLNFESSEKRKGNVRD
ncbi:MAG: type II toxin-antitoxin system VapC family toxin [Proteobacteria bacterium]|nr:type II toxin-antitoxin system VapC family toxin [Pseudomonadota bacterium]